MEPIAPTPYIKQNAPSVSVAQVMVISHSQTCTECTETYGNPGLLTFPCGHVYDLHCARVCAWMNDLAYCVCCRIKNPANLEYVLNLVYRCAHAPNGDSSDSIACHKYDAVVTGRTPEGDPMQHYNFELDRWVAPLPLRSVWA